MNAEMLRMMLNSLVGDSASTNGAAVKTPYLTDAVGNITNAWNNTFGDGSFNDPSKKEFWQAGTNPDVSEQLELPDSNTALRHLQQQQALKMFSGRDNTPQGATLNPWVNDGSVAPVFPSDKKTPVVPVKPLVTKTPLVPKTPAIKPIPAPLEALPDTNPAADATWGQAVSNTPSIGYSNLVPASVASNTGGFKPYTGNSTVNSGATGGTSWMDSLNDFFGLKGDDAMSFGELAGGIGGALEFGLGTYGTLEMLDQGQQQLDQGWRQRYAARETR